MVYVSNLHMLQICHCPVRSQIHQRYSSLKHNVNSAHTVQLPHFVLDKCYHGNNMLQCDNYIFYIWKHCTHAAPLCLY